MMSELHLAYVQMAYPIAFSDGHLSYICMQIANIIHKSTL